MYLNSNLKSNKGHLISKQNNRQNIQNTYFMDDDENKIQLLKIFGNIGI